MMAELQLGFFRKKSIKPVRQSQMAECGLACLAMVASYFGLDVDLGTLRRQLNPSVRGLSLRSLITMADQLSMNSRAIKVPLQDLCSLRGPAILHWNLNHFVVLEKATRRKALIHDPAGQSGWRPIEEVSQHYTGIALQLTPAEDFEPGNRRERLHLSQLWQRLSGLKRTLGQVIVLSMVMQAFILASPYYTQVALDDALPALDGNLLVVLAMGFGLFTAINAGATLLRFLVLLSAGTSLSYGISSNVARRLFKLPIDWFERRHTGDILSRFQSVAPIRQFLVEGAVGTALDGLLTLLTLAMMIFYSVTLAAVAVGAAVSYLMLRVALFPAQRRAQEETIVASGREQTTMIETLRGIVTLRLYNREALRHAVWQSRLADSMNASADMARFAAFQTVGNGMITGLEAIVSVWIAIAAVMNGGFSVGMLVAYMAYKTQFLQRTMSLVDQISSFRLLSLHLDRIADIALASQDPSFLQSPQPRRELVGRVEFKGVSFRYDPTERPVLDGIDLMVEPGEHIAITGPSGGGKTTLVKVLLGFLQPDEGEILIDGRPMARFGHKNFQEQVGAVLQDDHLFTGSLADNIALFDESPDHDRIREVTEAAALLGDVEAMPMGFETMVGDMGSSLSGGQRQRLLLARALYRSPRLLVMDEGTSHLDSSREQAVNAAIARLGVTRVIIAHRLETIMAADRIYAVANGKIEEITDSMRSTFPTRVE